MCVGKRERNIKRHINMSRVKQESEKTHRKPNKVGKAQDDKKKGYEKVHDRTRQEKKAAAHPLKGDGGKERKMVIKGSKKYNVRWMLCVECDDDTNTRCFDLVLLTS